MMRSTALLLWGLLFLLGACGDDDPSGSCTSDAQCADAHECTIDTCVVGGVCRHEPEDSRCIGGSCSVTSGCIDGMECMTEAECNDSIDCTLDSCAVGGVCRNMPLNERCGMGETCDPAMMGCVGPMGCTTDAECADSQDCTEDTCGVGGVCSITPIDSRCDTAMGERCSMTRGCYVPMPCTTPADCDDGNFCNGDEICMPEFGCDSAPMPRMCNDSDDCTVDACDMGMNMCTFTCDTTRPECDCPVAGATCEGRFMLTVMPSATFGCNPDFVTGMPTVTYDFSTATFERVGPLLQITPTSSSFAPLSDGAAPVCPEFEANTTVAGGCIESYTLRGTFTDDDNFTGTLDVTFTGMCLPAITGCSNHARSVIGRRIP
jgi:hypothetical protein